MFSKNMDKAVREFVEFTKDDDEEAFIDIEKEYDINEDNVEEVIRKELNKRGLDKKDLYKKEHVEIRNNLIMQLVEESNLSKRKIAKVMEINRETVRRLSKEPSR